METLKLRAMNTDVLLAAEGQADELASSFARAREFIQLSERRFTRFSDESELSSLNRSAGERFYASADLFTMVALTRRFFHLTRGLFDPSILPDLQKVGYDRSMDLVRRYGAAPLFESLLEGERPSLGELDLEETDHSILLPVGMALDLGGIAKGWIAEKAANILAESSSACVVDAGGDMFMVGLPAGMEQWPVELEDPFDPDAVLTSLNVNPGAIATSTVTKRTWKQGEVERHHIIDPRTHSPAVTEWVSVTVTAPHAYEAEVFAKALLIGGSEEAQDLLRTSGMPISYLAVDRNRKIFSSQELLEDSYVNPVIE